MFPLMTQQFIDAATMQAYNQVDMGFKTLRVVSPYYLGYLFDDMSEILLDEPHTDIYRLNGITINDMGRVFTHVPEFEKILRNLNSQALKSFGIYHPSHPLADATTSLWAYLIYEDYRRIQEFLLHLDLNGPASESDFFDVDHIVNSTYLSYGNNTIDQGALAKAIGPKLMMAMHALYHEVGPDQFHDFIKRNHVWSDNITTRYIPIALTDAKEEFVVPKWPQEFMAEPSPFVVMTEDIPDPLAGRTLDDTKLQHYLYSGTDEPGQ